MGTILIIIINILMIVLAAKKMTPQLAQRRPR